MFECFSDFSFASSLWDVLIFLSVSGVYVSISRSPSLPVLPFLDDNVSSIGYQDTFLYVNGAFSFPFSFCFSLPPSAFPRKVVWASCLYSPLGVKRKLWHFFPLDTDRFYLVFRLVFIPPILILAFRSLVSSLLSPPQYHFVQRNMCPLFPLPRSSFFSLSGYGPGNRLGGSEILNFSRQRWVGKAGKGGFMW